MNGLIPRLRSISALSYWRYTRLKRCLLSGAFPHSVEQPVHSAPTINRSQILGQIFHAQMEKFHELVTADQLTKVSVRCFTW